MAAHTHGCAVLAGHDIRAHTEPVLTGKLASHHSHQLMVPSAKHWGRRRHTRNSTAAKDDRNMHCPFTAPFLPLGAAHSALPGCSPHQTSSLGSGAHSNHGCAAACLQGACGRTYTAPLVCTVQGRQEEKELPGRATNGTCSWTRTY